MEQKRIVFRFYEFLGLYKNLKKKHNSQIHVLKNLAIKLFGHIKSINFVEI